VDLSHARERKMNRQTFSELHHAAQTSTLSLIISLQILTTNAGSGRERLKNSSAGSITSVPILLCCPIHTSPSLLLLSLPFLTGLHISEVVALVNSKK